MVDKTNVPKEDASEKDVAKKAGLAAAEMVEVMFGARTRIEGRGLSSTSFRWEI